MSPGKSIGKPPQTRFVQDVPAIKSAQAVAVVPGPRMTIKKPIIRGLLSPAAIEDSKSRVSPSADPSAATVTASSQSLHPRHRRAYPAVTSNGDGSTFSTPLQNDFPCGYMTAPPSPMLTPLKPQATPPKTSSSIQRRTAKSEGTHVDDVSESSASSEEWRPTSDDESDVSDGSMVTDELDNDDANFINDGRLSTTTDGRQGSLRNTAEVAETETPIGHRNAQPSWNGSLAWRRASLRKRPRIESPTPRLGPSESILSSRLRKRRRIEALKMIGDPTASSEPTSSTTVITDAGGKKPGNIYQSLPALKEGNIFSNKGFTFKFSRQIRNYAIPEEEYRQTGGVLINHEQFQNRDTGRPGEMNVLYVLLRDPEWLAHDDGWAKYLVTSPPPVAPRS